MKYCADPFAWQRRATREVKVGPVGVGGDNPIRTQTMLTSDTMNTAACVREAIPILEAGCEILRLTAPSINDAKNLKNFVAAIRQRGFTTPIVADIHFVPAAAMEAARWVEKIRVNPGNYADRKKFAVREYSDDQYADELERLAEAFGPLVKRCQELGRSMRIGTNHGSLSDRIMNRYGDTPLGMVESAIEFVRICRHHGYHELILSMKASNPKVMIAAYRLLVARLQEEGSDWNYPLHLGVTEAGEGQDGRIKSAIGIGALLADGLGDTVRVSLTEDSVHEIPVCQDLVAKYNTRWELQKVGQASSLSKSAPHASAPSQPLAADKREACPTLRVTERRDPYRFARRATHEVVVGGLRLGRDNPPRVEILVPRTASVAEIQRLTTAEPDTFAEILQFPVASAADLQHLAALRTQLRTRNIFTPLAVRLTGPLPELAAALRRADPAVEKINVTYTGHEDLASLLDGGPGSGPAIQFDVSARSPAELVTGCTALTRWLAQHPAQPALAAVARADGLELIAAYRILAASLPENVPILLRDQFDNTAPDIGTTSPLLVSSTVLGSLLCDGIGDLIEIRREPEPLAAVKLAYHILQAAGTRSFKTDYVACPSCGRTLFDLQTVTARIKSRTGHLKGVKIAVMGCIVNGPGEMADADFGYVGTAPGRISLWVGKTQVKQHLPEDQAVDELVALIRQHGKWIDPAP